ncbi:hypothetical protein OJF2_02650 [Aquisphaera giovannonii]|uniref:DUF3037 domain-containing protein n=1 Tax=Aquisphaera giovannonii TaxID=406548 RepID=A0A5B9VVQ6_9BACT|nr:DUF3037 domain-containing protein [Aquisphaera giovannonii]QEH31800.1 hypothetical protein OJF2_02650 [Aquisphaera giovannonii]
MNARPGYYSIIQFCPDLSRLEAANVGVILFCPESSFLEARVSPDNSRIQKFFGKQSFDWTRVNSYKAAVQERLEREGAEFRKPEDLEAFARRHGNAIQITAPRPVTVGDPARDLDQLFEEVVGVRKRPNSAGGFRRQLARKLGQAQLGRKLRRDIELEVPGLQKRIEVPFGYKNGRFNLIQPVSFRSDDPAQVVRTASVHAVEGIALYREPDPRLGDLQLVVVGNFASSRRDTRDRVGRILHQGAVQLYASSEVDDLIADIQAHGKELDDELEMAPR